MTNRKKGIIALFVLSVVWASFGLPIRYLDNHFTIFQQIYVRIFAAIIISSIIFYKDVSWKKLARMPKRDWLVLLFRVIVLYGFAITLYTQAFTLTTFGNISFLQAIPTTAVLGFIFLQEKVTIKKIILIVIATLGVALVTVKDFSHFLSWSRGDVMALISDFFFSLSYISRKWHTSLLNNKELAVFMLTFGFVIVFLLSLTSGQPLPKIEQINTITFLVILAAGFLGSISLFLTNYGFAYVESALASNIIALESFVAIILGYLFYQEVLSLQAFIGGLLILSSVVFLNKEEERSEKNK